MKSYTCSITNSDSARMNSACWDLGTSMFAMVVTVEVRGGRVGVT